MKNLLKVFGVIAFVTVIGFSFAACGNGTTSGDSGGGGNSALNGTWVSVSGEERITLSGNSFTQYYGSTPVVRGTFSTSGNNMTVTITAVYGDGRWYTRNDFANMGAPASELNEIFAPETGTYSLSGDTLTVNGETYTRE